MSETYKGRCLCGAVEVAVTGPAIAEGFCHCHDCRAWSGAAVTSYALWPADAVTLTGETLVNYSRTGLAHRKHCGTCGTLIAVSIPSSGIIDVFPHRLEGRPVSVRAHVHYASRVVDMPDGVPKFADLPAEAGGSGAMIED